MTHLVFLSGSRKGTRIKLDRPRMSIGRERSNDIVLEDTNLSRRHAELFVREGAYRLSDLHSTNGTYVNGAPISDEVRLMSGDNIVIGDTSMVFEETEGSRVIHAVEFKDDRESDDDSRQVILDPRKSQYLDPTKIAVRPEAATRLSALYQFISSITPILSVERLSNMTIAGALEAIPADRGFIMLLDEEGNLQPAAMKLRDPDGPPGDVQVSRRMTTRVMESGESILSIDPVHDGRFKDSIAIVRNRISSFICAPLKSRERLIGLLYVDTFGTTSPLSEDDLQLLTAMAQMAGAQFSNARLYGELLNSHEFTESILKCLRSGVMVTGSDGVVSRVNAAACELFALGEEEWVGKPLAGFKNLDPVRKVVEETLLSGIPSERQEIIVQVAGNMVPVGLSTSLLRDHENRVRGVVTNFRSLSVIKKLSEQVRMSQHLAALGEMAAGVAHEIRNPLNSIRGFAQLLESAVVPEDPAKAETSQKYLGIIIDEVDRMNRLVQDLLDFSRQRELTMAQVDMVKLADAVIAEMAPGLSDAGVHLETEYESELPPIMCNEAKVKQVLVNLVQNAIQAMTPPVAPEGHPRRLRVSVRHDTGSGGGQDVIRVAVGDSGVGIPAEALQRIFEPFFTMRDQGTGLGLAICRKIAEQHGGTLEVESTTGVGTTFSLVLRMF